jgi:transient receptor potential cation channel subfamily M protein 2
MIEFLYDESAFRINKPQLIISVTGGAQKFTIPQKMKNAFKLGLIKAAISTNALIITGGTNAGVMKLVGDAIAESVVDLSKVAVLGIATWGKVAYRNKLVVNMRNNN